MKASEPKWVNSLCCLSHNSTKMKIIELLVSLVNLTGRDEIRSKETTIHDVVFRCLLSYIRVAFGPNQYQILANYYKSYTELTQWKHRFFNDFRELLNTSCNTIKLFSHFDLFKVAYNSFYWRIIIQDWFKIVYLFFLFIE